MKIAILADIHANHVALQACIDYALKREITTFVFLGDYVGDLAYPRKTMEFLYKLKKQYECYFVKGNKEDYWLNYRSNGEKGWKEVDSTTGCLLYTYQQLREEDFKFFEEMSHVEEVKISDMPQFTICHGSQRRTGEKLLVYDENCYEAIENDKNELILCGHSHVRDKFVHAGKTIINPGSVGTPFNSNGKAQFMILHGDNGRWMEEFVDVDYDIEQTIRELTESGLTERAPGWCKVTEHILQNGDISHSKVLNYAMKLCEQETGKCIWPDISEKYWTQAIAEILI